MKSIVFLLMASLFTLSSAIAEDDNLPPVQVLTQSTPPFSYVSKGSPLDEGAEVVGPVADMVREYLSDRNINYKIHITKWSAAFQRAKDRSLTFIYPLDRTPARENDFFWIEPLFTQSHYIYLRNDPKLTNLTLDDIVNSDLVATCSKNTVICQILESLSIPEDRIIKSVGLSIPKIQTMITKGQADFTVFNDDVYNSLAVKYKFEDKKLKKMSKVSEKTSYLAAGKNLEPKILKALEQ